MTHDQRLKEVLAAIKELTERVEKLESHQNPHRYNAPAKDNPDA